MSLGRALGFAVRSTLRWSMPALRRCPSLSAVEAASSAQGRVRLTELQRQFPSMSRWIGALSMPEWRESLYALDVVSTHLGSSAAGRALDIGSKNGAMLPGLATALPAGWDAVELDAHRRYLWGSTRRVYGESLAALFPDCRFLAADVRTVTGEYSVITWFLPFLTPEPLSAWGLPDSHLAPEALLRHALGLLRPGGVMLVVNQGDHEAELQQALFSKLAVPAQALGPVTSALSLYSRPRFGFRVVKRRAT
jgi:SAM-dependent methyltransferase